MENIRLAAFLKQQGEKSWTVTIRASIQLYDFRDFLDSPISHKREESCPSIDRLGSSFLYLRLIIIRYDCGRDCEGRLEYPVGPFVAAIQRLKI